MKTLKTIALTLAVIAILDYADRQYAMACPIGSPDCVADANDSTNTQLACSSNYPNCLACAVGDPGCFACSAGDPGCNRIRVVRQIELACDSSGASCKVAPVPKTLLACVIGVDCVADCLAYAHDEPGCFACDAGSGVGCVACDAGSGTNCYVAPTPKTLLACNMAAGDCVAIAVLPPPELA